LGLPLSHRKIAIVYQLFDGMHVSALHAAVNFRKHLKVDLSRREVLTLMALFTFWQCKIISPSYNLLLERCVGAKRSTMFTAMKSLEDRGLLVRRSFLDRKDGSRHVVFFLDLPGIFTDECCAQLDSDPKAPITTRHTIEVGRTASTEEILAMVTFADVSQWQEIDCKLTRRKLPLGNFDDLSGFLLPCPDNFPVREEEEPKPELRVAVSDNQGDLFDMLHEANTQETGNKAAATHGTEDQGAYGTSWPTADTIPGGSTWAPADVEDTSTVPATPAVEESVQERAERIIRDHPGDDVIDAEIIDVEIVEDETPSDTLIDIPVSQELAITAPKTPVKPKGNSEGEFEKEFAKFYEIFPRHVGRKPAFEAWKKVLKAGKKTAAELIEAADAYAKYRAGKPKQYTLHPATWLNQERWADEYEEDNTGYGSGQYGSRMSPEEAAANRAAVSSTFMRTIRMWGFSSMEEYLEHEAAKEEIAREDEEKRYAEQAAILNPF
jgi:hypothetical protein